jgi:ribosomal protein S25
MRIDELMEKSEVALIRVPTGEFTSVFSDRRLTVEEMGRLIDILEKKVILTLCEDPDDRALVAELRDMKDIQVRVDEHERERSPHALSRMRAFTALLHTAALMRQSRDPATVLRTERAQRVRNFVSKNGGVHVQDIADQCDLRPGVAEEIADSLADNGVLRVKTHGSKRERKYYGNS